MLPYPDAFRKARTIDLFSALPLVPCPCVQYLRFTQIYLIRGNWGEVTSSLSIDVASVSMIKAGSSLLEYSDEKTRQGDGSQRSAPAKQGPLEMTKRLRFDPDQPAEARLKDLPRSTTVKEKLVRWLDLRSSEPVNDILQRIYAINAQNFVKRALRVMREWSQ